MILKGQIFIRKLENYLKKVKSSNLGLQFILKLGKLLLDHSMPVLVKSLRSQRVRYVTAGEYHTAALTEVECIS